MKFKQILILLLFAVTFLSCSKKENKNQIIVGIPADIESLNPLYAFSVEEGNIVELLYLSLVESNWDKDAGEMSFTPMLASSWEWNYDENSITIEIRDDVFWSDGVKCSIDDVIFSFDIYSDPKIKSRFVGYFENFYTNEKGYIDSSKTFEKISNRELKIKFSSKSKLQLIDIDYPILPKHFYSKFKRENIPTLQTKSYISNGAFAVERWEKEEAIILTKNPKSFLVKDETVKKIIFKVIPDYQNRINQLLTGDIDLMEDIKIDDIITLKEDSTLLVVPIEGRDFAYIGWNNISPSEYENSKIVPHILFGSAKVRKALTLALDRRAVTEEFLKGYGQLASTPLSPIYSRLIDTLIVPFDHNQKLASEILAREGWTDTNGDGTIDKNGIEFVFKLHLFAGNPRRDFAASLFKNNLKAVGIDVEIDPNEYGLLVDGISKKKFDAWMATWVVPIPVNLKISWQSDLANTPLNFPSYQNPYLDKLFAKLNGSNANEEAEIYKNIQKILYNDQPYTFLYWVDNIVCYNNRISNLSVDPLGAVKHCWKWELK